MSGKGSRRFDAVAGLLFLSVVVALYGPELSNFFLTVVGLR